MEGNPATTGQTQENVIPGVKHVIAVSSGKGGVESMRAGASDFLLKDTPFDGTHVLPALERVAKMRALRQDNLALRHETEALHTDYVVHCPSAAWQRVMDMVRKIAPSTAPVLIQGETGSGKEIVARALHAQSPRREHPFLAVNCGAIKADLLESELFGYEKGAFTGAVHSKSGLLAAAEGGTLFLDEISEMSGALQVNLLRVLDRREYRQVGGTRTLTANVRFVAASNRDLQELVFAGRFRDDLLYRINTVGLHVPPLRERHDDIPVLAQHFLRMRQPAHRPTRTFSPAALDVLRQYHWPGNVRELHNIVERIALLASPGLTGSIEAEEIASMLLQTPRRRPFAEPDGYSSLEDVEKEYILRVLAAHEGNKTQAARVLDVDYKTLLTKLKKYET